MQTAGSVNILTDGEIDRIAEDAMRVLGEIGVLVENDVLIELLRDFGATVSSDRRVRFSRGILDGFLQGAAAEYDEVDGLEVSCTLPYGRRAAYANGVECTAGTYPQMYMALDGSIRPHTLQTVSDMTRLADHCPNFDRLGAMGVPSDVPGILSPLYMRLIAWRHAQNKLSSCGEVQDRKLIPYILEMGKVMADGKKTSLRHHTFAEVELISPLKFMEAEAAIFVDMWQRGLLCGIGFMHSTGGSSPVTLAATLTLDLAESLFVCILYRLCYGLKKLWFQMNASVLDMKHAMFCFGRPERGLMALGMGQIARRFNAGLWASGVFADAKVTSCEAGMQAAFTMIPAIMAGSLGLECFGLLSGAEMGSPVQLIIDNEFAGALKRFARGFEVSTETLAYDVIKEEAVGGLFAGNEHTVRHFRNEQWAPSIFSRENLSSWRAAGARSDIEQARDVAGRVFKDYWPQGISEDVERELLGIIESARQKLL
ncbi:MAG: trimethylamine methyltransferase family protein [Kiritimatiellae bacterium]|nr:trimethylamine methyltransferase family protein [Verrucomicrobiota bacterium]MCG2659462.1 trimethylamine methyltransferase family protein [Kiritimatiellia bacterium]